MTQTSTADRIAQLTATRDSLIAAADNESNLPTVQERAIRMARYLITQIAELGDAKVCRVCELAIATQAVPISNTDDVHTCLTCGTMLTALL